MRELTGFVRGYRRALRIDEGPFPDTLAGSDPFFERLRPLSLDGKPPSRDLWTLTLSFLGEGGAARSHGPELPLPWEGKTRPTVDEVLAVLVGIIDNVWDSSMQSCSQRVGEEDGPDVDSPAANVSAREDQCAAVVQLRAFLGTQAFEALRTSEYYLFFSFQYVPPDTVARVKGYAC